MAVTDNLNITEVATNQAEKETTMNTAINALDDATQGELAFTFTANARTLSTPEFTRSFAFSASNQTADGALTIPLTKRFFAVQNGNGTYNIIVGGVTGATVIVPPGALVVLYCDGTNCIGATLPVSVGPVPYSSLPAEVKNVPLTVSFAGQPSAGREVIIPITQNLTLPADFVGTVGYADTVPAADAPFGVTYIRSGTPTALAAPKFALGASSLTLPTQALVNLLVGDVLKVTAPTPQDATLANCALTLMLLKV